MIEGSAIERVSLGVPAAQAVAAEAAARDARRVFLLVSTHLRTQTDEIARIESALGARLAGVHSGLRAHVPKADLLTAAGQALDLDCDLIVAVGGGSVADAGKILTLCLRHGVRDQEALDRLRLRPDKDGRPVAPDAGRPEVRVIAVPTTLSAGEFNPLSGATDEARGRKDGFRQPGMTPACVILDPAITRHTPEWLWLSTGVRALDHAVETLASLDSNEYADGLAESGLRRLMVGLSRVKERSDDLEARLKCQVGAWLSILPLIGGVPMGASHAVGHALGSLCGVPHGYTSCVMAPFVQRWNAGAGPARRALLAAALGVPDRPIDETLHDFIGGLGMPRSLAEVGVGEPHLPKLAEIAFHDAWGRTNPRPVAGAHDMLEILRLAGPAA